MSTERGHKHLYIAARDRDVWKRAEAAAESEGMSLSVFVALALEYTLQTGEVQRAKIEERA